MAIVVSILLAFAIQAWWEGRQADETQAAYLSRLSADLIADTSLFRYTEGRVDGKLRALAKVAETLRTSVELTDTAAFLETLDSSAAFGFQIPVLPRATMDDLLNTGNLSAIQDIALRTRITDYYRLRENWRGRIAELRGQYPYEVRRIVPWAPTEASSLGTVDYSVQLRDSTYPPVEIMRRVRSSSLDELLPLEQNRGVFIATAFANMRAQAVVLLRSLEEVTAQ